MSSLSFEHALKAYYQHQHADGHKPEKNGLLVFDNGKWKEILLTDRISSDIFRNTMQKVVSLDITKVDCDKLHYWIKQFNSAMSLDCLKTREIKPLDASAARIQFSSMNTYRWLSNFFLTLIYDPKYDIIYPSVENGYVAFKARKGGLSEDKVIVFAHLIGSKDVKQAGKDVWKRETEEDDKAAIEEMERLVHLKFSQNPFLASWLNKSTTPLEEFTNDCFWGSAMGTMGDEENSNHLGKIIEKVRLSEDIKFAH